MDTHTKKETLKPNNINKINVLTPYKPQWIKKSKAFFEKRDGESVSVSKVNVKADKLLREFILAGGIEL